MHLASHALHKRGINSGHEVPTRVSQQRWIFRGITHPSIADLTEVSNVAWWLERISNRSYDTIDQTELKVRFAKVLTCHAELSQVS